MASSQSNSLQLIIRTANNKYSDFNLQLPSTTTVWQLKEHITLTHPTKPVPEDQRLIFAGKLLDDPTVLQQILTKSNSAASTYTIHLVLQADRNQSPVRNVSTPSTTPKPAEQPASAPARSSAYEQYVSQLNEYQQRLDQFVSSPNGMPSGWDVHSQVYLQYCQTHYQIHNLLAYQRANGATAAATPVVPPSSTPPPPPPVPPVVNAPAANNNNNNPNNEFEQENDLLGVLNMLAELFVLCSIIYFYSTFNRFLVVFVLFSLLYLHYRGYLSFQRRRRVVNPPAPPAAPANEAEPAARDDEPEAEPVLNDAEPNRPETPAPRANPSDETPISATRLFVTAVSTFFSSLIPERPPRI